MEPEVLLPTIIFLMEVEEFDRDQTQLGFKIISILAYFIEGVQ